MIRDALPDEVRESLEARNAASAATSGASFETRRFATLLRMRACFPAKPQDENLLLPIAVTDPNDTPTQTAAESALSPALRGIGWMIACGVLFGVLNTAQKFLAHEMHPPQVLCLRYLVGSAVLLPFVARAGWDAYRPGHLPLLVLRGSVHLVGTIIWFLVLPHVTLAENSAIGFTGPIFMMLGAWLFLGERMDAMRWAAVLVAFAGVLIVLAPGLAEANLGTIYSVWLLVASPIFAISFLMSKTLTRYDRPEAIVFWLGIMVGVLSLPFALTRIALTDSRGRGGVLLAVADDHAMGLAARLRAGRIERPLLHDARLPHRRRFGRAAGALPRPGVGLATRLHRIRAHADRVGARRRQRDLRRHPVDRAARGAAGGGVNPRPVPDSE